MDRFIYIRNAEDDAYMNKVSNFKGMTQTGSAAVTLLFEAAQGAAGNNAGFDSIVLAVTANKEKEAMIAIGGALAGSKSGSTAVIADDHGAKYCDDTVTAVTTITKNTAGNALKKLVSWTADVALEASDSGAWVYAADATALDLRLPTASGNAGVFYEIFIQKAQTGDTHILAEAGDFFEGALTMFDADTATENIRMDVAATAEDDVINLDDDTKGRLAGGFIKLVCDGTKWHVTGQLNGTGALATPFHTAES
jgi:hypothetical protein